MKKITLLFTFLTFTSFFVNAQKQEERNARIKTIKIAFLTEKLNLTSKEAEKFWPVYNNYDDKIHQLEKLKKHRLISKIKKAGGIDSISEEEAETIFKRIKSTDNQIYNIKIEFNKKLAKILSYKKILKLKTAEKDFVRKLMRKYRKRRAN